jgi:hypothetical protein
MGAVVVGTMAVAAAITKAFHVSRSPNGLSCGIKIHELSGRNKFPAFFGLAL